MAVRVRTTLLLPLLALCSHGAMVSMEGRLDKARKGNSWQRRLDKALLGVDMKPEGRLKVLLQIPAKSGRQVTGDLQAAVEEIREKGFGKGHPAALELLLPTGTTARADLEGLLALRRQLPEALESLREPSLNSQPGENAPTVTAPPAPKEIISALVGFATDPAKQREAEEELKNAFRSTPRGLETPRYEKVCEIPGPTLAGRTQMVQIRRYEPYTVAIKQMANSASNVDSVLGSSDSGAGFQALASYLFGGNAEEESMAMTMPVEISLASTAAAAAPAGRMPSMSFVLPDKNADAPPTPLAGSRVEIAKRPSRLVAVLPFPGLVTDEEVQRQREAVVSSLAAAAAGASSCEIYAPVEPAQVSVLQYNSPITIPWRRRNEVAIVVEEQGAPVEGGQAVVSWYDAGGRL